MGSEKKWQKLNKKAREKGQRRIKTKHGYVVPNWVQEEKKEKERRRKEAEEKEKAKIRREELEKQRLERIEGEKRRKVQMKYKKEKEDFFNEMKRIINTEGIIDISKKSQEKVYKSQHIKDEVLEKIEKGFFGDVFIEGWTLESREHREKMKFELAKASSQQQSQQVII